MQLYH